MKNYLTKKQNQIYHHLLPISNGYFIDFFLHRFLEIHFFGNPFFWKSIFLDFRDEIFLVDVLCGGSLGCMVSEEDCTHLEWSRLGHTSVCE